MCNKLIKLIIFPILMTLTSFPVSVLAAAYDLPQPLVGQAEVIDRTSGVSQTNYWFGASANEVIRNTDPNAIMGFDIQAALCDGKDDLVTVAGLIDSFCYIFDRQSSAASGYSILNSRTFRNGVTDLEVAAIFRQSNTIQGDVYSNTDLNNFSFYGKNLNQSAGDVSGLGATWSTSNYTFNPDAQASYKDTQKSTYLSHIENLKNEARHISSPYTLRNTSVWYLNNSDITNPASGESAIPEGRVWYVEGDLHLDYWSNYMYINMGTIIVLGNLVIGNPDSVQPQQGVIAFDKNPNLGFIVLANPATGTGGSVTVAGDNVIVNAAIFAEGSISINNRKNVQMTGSFIASNFNVTNSSGIRFSYDYKLSQNWPPGFRFFNMPQAQNSAP